MKRVQRPFGDLQTDVAGGLDDPSPFYASHLVVEDHCVGCEVARGVGREQGE